MNLIFGFLSCKRVADIVISQMGSRLSSRRQCDYIGKFNDISLVLLQEASHRRLLLLFGRWLISATNLRHQGSRTQTLSNLALVYKSFMTTRLRSWRQVLGVH